MDKADESLMKLLTRNLDNMYQIDGVCILITKSEKHIQNSIMNIVFFMIIQAARGNRVLCFPYSVLYRPQYSGTPEWGGLNILLEIMGG